MIISLHRLMFFSSVFFAFFLFSAPVDAEQTQAFFVFLNRKADHVPGSTYGFHPKAIERRIQAGVNFPEWSDLQFVERDLEAIRNSVSKVRHPLRWVGAVSVEATTQQIEAILEFPFVDHVEAMGCYEGPSVAEAEAEIPKDTARAAKLYKMVRNMMHLDTLQQMGLTGKGVRIAVFDAGFTDTDMHPAFDHLRKHGLIEHSNDFYGGKGADVFYGSKHGTAVLGCLAGISPYGPIGAATGATYMLARTEHNHKEKPVEEDHWMAAAEWADRNGADIISSSLGYAKKRYEPKQMDGRTSLVSRAAALAVRKGILVVNSAGNEGQGKFKTIATPGDADSVLTVGASYPMVRFVMPFSSKGPNARGVLKPEISAPGYVLTAGLAGKWVEMPGTSFACPLVAGVAACLLEAEPKLTNLQARDRIIAAGHFHPYFDAALGHGVLDARYLFRAREVVPPTFQLYLVHDSLFMVPSDSLLALRSKNASNGLPLHISNLDKEGRLIAYSQQRVGPQAQKVHVPDPAKSTQVLRIWWEGYLLEVAK